MNVEKPVTKEWLFQKVTHEEVFEFYVGKKIHDSSFCSPLREDVNPSCAMYYTKIGVLHMKDFATGESLDCISLVKEMFGLDYFEALKKIASDFGLLQGDFRVDIIKKLSGKPLEIAKKKTFIQFQKKPFTKEDLEYWQSYGISENTLKFYDVHSVKLIYINRERFPLKKNTLCFVYYFPKSTHCKVYRPLLEKKKKWLSNINNDADIQGYYQANIKETKPKLLVLTSSLKEVMVLHEFGIKAMAIHGENSHYNPDFIRHLKKYCEKIVSIYDWDEAGNKAANKLFEDYQIEKISKPDYLNCSENPTKDLSDAYKYCGKEAIERFLKENGLI